MRVRALLVAFGALVILVGTAGPAAAINVQPGDTRSEVTGIDPPSDVVTARVLGRDALVELTVEPGHEVVVLGYDNEPYLRIDADGTVETNPRSPATSLNRTRTAATGADDNADAGAVPDWQPTGEGGTVAWHDHRAHSMVPQPVGTTTTWEIPLTVDGAHVAIQGELTRVPSRSLLPWLALAATVGVMTVVLGRHHPGPTAVAAVGTAAAIALVVGGLDRAAIPGAASRPIGFLAAPALAAFLALLAAPWAGRRRLLAVLASVSILGGWLVVRAGVLAEPVLVTTLAPNLDRGLVAVVLGLTVAAAGLAVLAPGGLATPGGPDGPAREKMPR